MASKRIYTATFDWTLAAGAGNVSNFEINTPGRELKIKSITLDHYIATFPGLLRVPPEQNTTQRIQLAIGGPGQQVFASVFNNTGGIPANNNGNYYLISKPCQLIFDSFYIRNVLPLTLVLNNNGAAIFVNVISVMVETEEKIIYY